jgi:hypothetical protein
MTFAKTLLATATAVGLMAAPMAAQAAPARAASPVANSEELAGEPFILYAALAAFAIGMVILLASDDSDEAPTPVSP